MMNKLTSIFLASLASVASARLTRTGDVNTLNLRKNGAGEAYDARIIVNGLQQDMSKTDLKTIEESAVAAYNDVFSEVGFAIDGLKTQASIPLDSMSWAPLGKGILKSAAPPPPDDSTITDDNEIIDDDDDTPTDNSNIVDGDDYTSGGCGRIICTNEASILNSNSAHAALIFAGVDWYNNQQGGHSSAVLPNVAQLYKAFEVSFCSKLRSSGVTNLVDAKDCSFSFVEKPGNSGRTKNLSPVESARRFLLTFQKTIQSTVLGF